MNTPVSLSDYRARLGRPLLVLLLGIAPFWVFAGSTSQTTLDGQLAGEEAFNILGLAMALIGLSQAVRMLREDWMRPPRWLPRTVLLVVAALVCAFQLGHSGGLYSVRDVWVKVAGQPAPPPSTYAGLSAAQVQSTESASRQRGEAGLRGDIATTYALIRGQSQLRNIYAEACYPALPPLELPGVPAFLQAEDRKKIDDYEQAMIRAGERRCTEANTRGSITRKQDEIARLRDIVAIQERIHGK
jgi:hypothetical protein